MTSAAEHSQLGASVADALLVQLAERLDVPVTLVRTRNRVRLVSYRKLCGAVEVRVSHRLLELGLGTISPIVAFVCEIPDAREELRGLYAALPPVPSRPRSRPSMVPLGEVHDLRRILCEESTRAFGAPLALDITWGPRRRRWKPQRSIRLGAYHFDQGYIRIHRRLDHPAVPDWFVGFVVFHELLHHRFGASNRGGRRILHPPAFRRAEAEHPRYLDARAWERAQLPKLLRGGRR